MTAWMRNAAHAAMRAPTASAVRLAQVGTRFRAVLTPTRTAASISRNPPTGAQKGKTQYGIYKLDGDKWTVAMTRPGVAETERPKGFDTKDTANVVFTFERVKAEK